jgi:hypothetical protein
MRKFILAAGAAVVLGTLPGFSGGKFWSCGELWQNRNQIYKDQGYCFRTARAIRVFGNAGCQYDNVDDLPLSANQRRDIREIARYERIRRCPR